VKGTALSLCMALWSRLTALPNHCLPGAKQKQMKQVHVVTCICPSLFKPTYNVVMGGIQKCSKSICLWHKGIVHLLIPSPTLMIF
jgi:hypothetical protein